MCPNLHLWTRIPEIACGVRWIFSAKWFFKCVVDGDLRSPNIGALKNPFKNPKSCWIFFPKSCQSTTFSGLLLVLNQTQSWIQWLVWKRRTRTLIQHPHRAPPHRTTHMSQSTSPRKDQPIRQPGNKGIFHDTLAIQMCGSCHDRVNGTSALAPAKRWCSSQTGMRPTYEIQWTTSGLHHSRTSAVPTCSVSQTVGSFQFGIGPWPWIPPACVESKTAQLLLFSDCVTSDCPQRCTHRWFYQLYLRLARSHFFFLSRFKKTRQNQTRFHSWCDLPFYFQKNNYGIHNHHVSRFDELSYSVHVTTFILHSVINVNGWLLPNWRTFSQNVVSAPT